MSFIGHEFEVKLSVVFLYDVGMDQSVFAWGFVWKAREQTQTARLEFPEK